MLAYGVHHDATDAIAWGQLALETLAASQPSFRCIAALAVGMAMVKIGNIRGAKQVLAEARNMASVAENI